MTRIFIGGCCFTDNFGSVASSKGSCLRSLSSNNTTIENSVSSKCTTVSGEHTFSIQSQTFELKESIISQSDREATNTVFYVTGAARVTLSLSNFSNNRVPYLVISLICAKAKEMLMTNVNENPVCDVIQGVGEITTVRKVNFIRNQRPLNFWGLFYGTGDFLVEDSVFIENVFVELKAGSGEITLVDSVFFKCEFSTEPIVTTVLVWPSTNDFWKNTDWECLTNPKNTYLTEPFSDGVKSFKSFLFVLVII